MLLLDHMKEPKPERNEDIEHICFTNFDMFFISETTLDQMGEIFPFLFLLHLSKLHSCVTRWWRVAVFEMDWGSYKRCGLFLYCAKKICSVCD